MKMTKRERLEATLPGRKLIALRLPCGAIGQATINRG